MKTVFKTLLLILVSTAGAVSIAYFAVKGVLARKARIQAEHKAAMARAYLAFRREAMQRRNRRFAEASVVSEQA